MICPHCGSDQPIAEHCSQCGGDLFRTTSRITIIEEIASNKWVKLFFALSLVIAALGAYWLYEGVGSISQNQPAPTSLEMNVPVASQPTDVATGKLPARPTTVIVLGKIGEYEPLLVRNFESSFEGIVREHSIEQPGLLEEIKKEKPDFLVILGPSAERFMTEHSKEIVDPNPIIEISLTDHIASRDLQQKNYLAVSSRPNPDKVIESCREILRNINKHIIVLYDPNTDQEYVDALYGAGLEEKYNMEIMEVKDGTSLTKSLNALPQDFGALIVIESLRLTTKQASAIMNHFMSTANKPVIAIGSYYGKQGALLELTADLSQVGKQLPKIIKEFKDGTLPNAARPWIKSEALRIILYKSNAAKSKIFQAEQIARIYEQHHPEVHVSYAN